MSKDEIAGATRSSNEPVVMAGNVLPDVEVIPVPIVVAALDPSVLAVEGSRTGGVTSKVSQLALYLSMVDLSNIQKRVLLRNVVALKVFQHTYCTLN